MQNRIRLFCFFYIRHTEKCLRAKKKHKSHQDEDHAGNIKRYHWLFQSFKKVAELYQNVLLNMWHLGFRVSNRFRRKLCLFFCIKCVLHLARGTFCSLRKFVCRWANAGQSKDLSVCLKHGFCDKAKIRIQSSDTCVNKTTFYYLHKYRDEKLEIGCDGRDIDDLV